VAGNLRYCFYFSLSLLRLSRFGRVCNLFKLIFSFLYSSITRHVYHSGMPFALSVEAAACCNLQCPECAMGKGLVQRGKLFIDEKLFETIIAQSSSHLLFLQLFFQGEPLMNKGLERLIKIAQQKKIFVSISTNAQLLNEELAKSLVGSGINHIILSLDGATQQTYQQYRVGGDIEKVLNALAFLHNAKKKSKQIFPLIEVQCLVTGFNEYELDQVKKLVHLADKVTFKSIYIDDLSQTTSVLPSNKKYVRYRVLSDGTLILKNKLHNRCWRMWSSAVVTSEGYVLPCCFDKTAQFSQGNLNLSFLKEIWKSNNYKRFRRQIITGRKDTVMCNNCTSN